MRQIFSCIATLIFVNTAYATTPVMGQTISPKAQLSQSVTFPCSLVLNPVKDTPNARGVALVYTVRLKYSEASPAYRQRTSISIHANHLPDPSSFGNYDGYDGFAQIPGKISWQFRLLPSREPQYASTYAPTWAGRFDEISTKLTPNTLIQVRLSNSKNITAPIGPVVLMDTLSHCK